MSQVDRLVREFAPDRVVLFGSYAEGSATDDSDVYLLVVMDHSDRNVEKSVASALRDPRGQDLTSQI